MPCMSPGVSSLLCHGTHQLQWEIQPTNGGITRDTVEPLAFVQNYSWNGGAFYNAGMNTHTQIQDTYMHTDTNSV